MQVVPQLRQRHAYRPALARASAEVKRFQNGADEFLKLVRQYESEWIRTVFDEQAVACETRLAHLLASKQPVLGQARCGFSRKAFTISGKEFAWTDIG